MPRTKEENLKKLRRTPILMNFIKKNDAEWDHTHWEDLQLKLQEKGYTPIDFNQVGLLLEEKKETYLAKK
ncbi:MAG: hypothetical protein U9O87_03515 [Verrucomicrobiota bacterium]|nr:hypothetical protein [Verrucomicrobiota bacterium]